VNRILLYSFIFFIPFNFSAQEKEKKKFKDVVDIQGYVKYMNTANFINLDTVYTSNLIHNRINLKVYLNDKLTFRSGIRNRIFYGETVKINPFFSKQVDVDNGLMDLSFLWLNNQSIVGLTQLDRLNFKYAGKRSDLIIGRQRINWGINMAWNTNDLFNAYNLVNFDYQECPGSDAVRYQYYFKNNSSLEFAAAPKKYLDSSTVAMRYQFNKFKYDFQLIAGNYNKDIVVGTGWAGNIKDAGFKGEASYFVPKYVNFSDTVQVFTLSTSFDYSFQKGIYVNASYLYNSSFPNQVNAANIQTIFASSLSAKSLMPSQHTYLAQVSGSFNPIIGGGMSVFYAQSLNLLFFMPSVSVSVAQNWNLDLFGQSAFLAKKMNHMNTGVFLRLQYSY